MAKAKKISEKQATKLFETYLQSEEAQNAAKSLVSTFKQQLDVEIGIRKWLAEKEIVNEELVTRFLVTIAKIIQNTLKAQCNATDTAAQ